MSHTYGRQTSVTTGIPIQVTADGEPVWKTGGVTLDWSTVGAVAADTTLADGTVIPAGQKGLQYGTVLCKIAASGKYGPYTTANAGTTVASGGTVLGVTTLTLASGANIDPGDTLQVDTAGQAESLVVASVAGAVVTFTTPTTKTHANGVAVAKADDGRQTLARGDCFILNQTVLQALPATLAGAATDNPPVFNAGRVWFARLQIVGGATATYLGAGSQPTRAAFEAAFPGIDYVHTAS